MARRSSELPTLSILWRIYYLSTSVCGDVDGRFLADDAHHETSSFGTFSGSRGDAICGYTSRHMDDTFSGSACCDTPSKAPLGIVASTNHNVALGKYTRLICYWSWLLAVVLPDELARRMEVGDRGGISPCDSYYALRSGDVCGGAQDCDGLITP